MKKNLIVSFIIGILIMIVPTIITGRLYNTSNAIGNMLISEFIIRNISAIVGLLVIYDGYRNLYSKQDRQVDKR